MINQNEQKKFWNDIKLHKRRDANHPAVKEFAVSKIDEIDSKISFTNKKVLELGAGNGFFSVYLDKICNLTATDFSKIMLDLNPAKRKKIIDARKISFNKEEFDIVFEANLLHHLDDVNRVISEMKRVAREYIIIIEPNRNNPLMFLFGLLKKVERGALKFSMKYIESLALNNELKIVSQFSHGIILPNKIPKFLLSILRLFEKKMGFFGFYNVLICKKNKIHENI